MGELAWRAEADLKAADAEGLAVKLKAVVAAATNTVVTVADVMGVTPQTVLRWVAAYRGAGLDGLRRKPKAPRRPKLGEAQKAEALSWLDAGRTAKGEAVHWTVDLLRAAVEEEFKVRLARNTVWVWMRKEGMRHKVPRPRHHAADAAAQEEFKKKRRR
jgi:transposase